MRSMSLNETVRQYLMRQSGTALLFPDRLDILTYDYTGPNRRTSQGEMVLDTVDMQMYKSANSSDQKMTLKQHIDK